MARIDSFLRLVVEQKASDLHFPAGSSPITDAPERQTARSAAAIAHGVSSCMYPYRW